MTNSNITDSKTVYILLKDLPNIDKGAELVWNGNEYTCPDKFGGIAKLHKLLVERCYPWFEKKKLKEAEVPKRIEVKVLDYKGWSVNDDGRTERQRYEFSLTDFIPDGKVDGLKKAIESFLNNEASDIPTLSRQDSGKTFEAPAHLLEGHPKCKSDTIQDKEINTKDVFHNFLNNGFITMQDYMKVSNIYDPTEVQKQLKEALQDKGDWEILAYNNFNKLGADKGGVRVKEKDDKFYFQNAINKVGYSDWQLQDWNIHSVRRLSDNVVFSIGDKVCFRVNTNPNWVIDNFLLKDDGTLLARSNSCDHCEFIDNDLIKLPPKEEVKPKPPLGLVPDYIWREERLDDIKGAIKRYLDAKLQIPISWITEQYELEHWILQYNENKITN